MSDAFSNSSNEPSRQRDPQQDNPRGADGSTLDAVAASLATATIGTNSFSMRRRDNGTNISSRRRVNPVTGASTGENNAIHLHYGPGGNRPLRIPIANNDNPYITTIGNRHMSSVHKKNGYQQNYESFHDLRFSRVKGGRDMRIQKLHIFEYSRGGGLFVQGHYAIDGSEDQRGDPGVASNGNIMRLFVFQPWEEEYIQGFTIYQDGEGQLRGLIVQTDQRQEAGKFGRIGTDSNACEMIAPENGEVFALCGARDELSTVMRFGFLSRPRIEPARPPNGPNVNEPDNDSTDAVPNDQNAMEVDEAPNDQSGGSGNQARDRTRAKPKRKPNNETDILVGPGAKSYRKASGKEWKKEKEVDDWIEEERLYYKKAQQVEPFSRSRKETGKILNKIMKKVKESKGTRVYWVKEKGSEPQGNAIAVSKLKDRIRTKIGKKNGTNASNTNDTNNSEDETESEDDGDKKPPAKKSKKGRRKS